MNYKTEVKIRNRAKFLTNGLAIKDLPVQPIKLIRQIYGVDIDIIYDDLCGEDGYILKANGRYRVCLDINKHNRRKNFTEAHEIGHIVLGHFKYRDEVRRIYYRHLEQQANIFASELLMPEHLIVEHLNALPELTPDSLAKRFHVSSDVMGIRMKDIEKKYKIPDSDKVSYGKNFIFYRETETTINYNIL